MAIILPNTRNALGVPSRYSDLASAGLRYTPPPVYRYDAYDVQGDEATLYEEDIDLADYQYNADSYDAAVVPAGYAALCGGDARWLIGTDTKLYYKNDVGTIYLPDGSPSGVTRVAYAGNNACLAIVNGSLYLFTMSVEEFFSQYLIDNTRVWTEISFVDFYNDSRCFAIGIADGKLAAVSPFLNDVYVSILSHTIGWKTSGGVKGEDFLVVTDGTRISSLVIDSPGYLHQVSATASGIPALSGALDLGTNWLSVSGYMKEISVPDGYQGNFPLVTSATRMYGIQAGLLFSLRHALSETLGAPSKTQVTEFSDWWKVVFVAPDEAVAIRRIEL
jgi:hypothetical protein